MTDAASELSSAPSTPASRLLSLDVFRGVTIAAMLLVNNPGTWESIYPPLRHAEWNGWTPADLIFPFFLFIVGITTHLSIQSRKRRGDDERTIVRQILKRGALIILLGLAFSAFPYFPLSRIIHLRIPGVLQRIGLTYALGALISLRTTTRQQSLIIVAILIGYWCIMTLVPVPGTGGVPGYQLLDTPSATLAAWLDRALLDGHLWVNSVTWDPEGILSSLPAVATVLLGILAGKVIAERLNDIHVKLNTLFAVGAIGMVVGLMWNWVFPINKNLWTSSYVVFTAGAASVTLATCIWLVDIKRITCWIKPFVIFGTNPIFAYVGSLVLARVIYSLIKVPFRGAVVPLQTVIYQTAFASWLSPQNASLAFALSVVLFWLGLLTILYRKQLFFKV